MISVIVPCYNAAPYLRACLDSLCAQTERDIEIIVVDDGSTDGSGAIADAYAAQEPRVAVLHGDNRGVSAARNAGLAAARGDRVAFVDADDTLPEGAFAALCGDADIVCGLIAEDDRAGERYVLTPLRQLTTRDAQIRALIDGDRVLNSPCNKLYSRALIGDTRFMEGLKIGEDALFNLELYARAGSTALVPEVTYTYRMHGGSAMHGVTREQHYARHLPWLAALRTLLCRLGLREAYFAAYCHSHVLRLYKARGVFGVLAAFNREVRAAVLEGVAPQRLPTPQKSLYAVVKAGCYPLLYAFTGPMGIAGRLIA